MNKCSECGGELNATGVSCDGYSVYECNECGHLEEL